MSEHAPRNHEELKGFEELAESSEHLLPAHNPEHHKVRQEKHKSESLQEARKEIAETNKHEHQPNPLERLEAAAEASGQAELRVTPSRSDKKANVQRQLSHLRYKLTPSERRFSKVIHQPVIRAISEVSGKTISRPSGMLGGSILAFFGSTSYLLLAKYQGFRYNYGVFLALFFGGFVVGITLEFIVWAATRSRHAAD